MKEVKRVLLKIEASRAYGRSLLSGIAEYSKRFGPWAFYHEEPFYSSSAYKTSKQIRELAPDGIITRFPKDVDIIKEQSVPTVVAIHLEKDIPGIPNVKGDNAAMGQMAAEYLLRLGFHKFGFCGLNQMFWSRDRCRAFTEAIHAAGFDPHIYVPPSKCSSQSTGSQLLADWLTSVPKPIAIMACNDDRGKELTEAAKIAGIRIPDDIAVIGTDNDETICDLCYPSLSSVKLNNVRAGYEAAKLLDALMRGQELETHEVIVSPIGVVQRQSTDVYCVQDREVAGALRYIRENSRKLIHVADVAESVCLSKRALQVRFKKVMGYSVHERIKKEKVDRMAELLTETNMPIVDIAASIGLSDMNHISRFFKAERGNSPLAYRKKYSMK